MKNILISILFIFYICQISHAKSNSVELILDGPGNSGLEILDSSIEGEEDINSDTVQEESNNSNTACLSVVSDCLEECLEDQDIIVSRSNGICLCRCETPKSNTNTNRKAKKK